MHDHEGAYIKDARSEMEGGWAKGIILRHSKKGCLDLRTRGGVLKYSQSFANVLHGWSLNKSINARRIWVFRDWERRGTEINETFDVDICSLKTNFILENTIIQADFK